VFFDARAVPTDNVLETDLCIVGCGAAGITLARELSRSTVRVVVLESGGLAFESPTNDLNKGAITGLPYFPLETARLRYFGGSTNHWGGLCRPEEPGDFEARAWIPESGWPIGRGDLNPYYPRAAAIVGVPVDDWDLDRWRARSPFPTLPLPADRITTVVAQVVESRERSFAPRYRAALDAAPNVAIHLHANVVDIETDESGRHVRRVHAATLEGNRFTVAAHVFVLATGGIENARLLLASDHVRPNGVGNDHGLVGRYFMEHPRFIAGLILPTDRRLPIGFYEPHHAGGTTLLGYLSLSQEAAVTEELTDVQVRLAPIYDPAVQAALDSPDVDKLRELADWLSGHDPVDDVGEDLSEVVGDLLSWRSAMIVGGPIPVPLPEVVDEVIRRARAGDLEGVIPLMLGDVATAGYRQLTGALPVTAIALSTRIEQVPNPDSRVTLGSERDALGMRRAELHWALADLDRRSVIRTLELLGAELGRTGLGRLRIDLEEESDTWPDDLAGGWHHMGTTRMSDDPAHGVVDRNCQVHGIDNLYVAGSSVFTTAGSGTPTMTIVALALRLAEHLKGALA